MNKVTLPLLCAPFVLGMNSMAQAQGTVDMSKYTCEKLLQGGGNSTDAAVWLSGYYNGLHKNTKLDLDSFGKMPRSSLRNVGRTPRWPSCRPLKQ